ncbi:hypothetical protein D7W82_33195 [Corallococcus sp. CA049B]|nr:hypothetical protein D7W82_33195 [Corallococcus sp. CA049B]
MRHRLRQQRDLRVLQKGGEALRQLHEELGVPLPVRVAVRGHGLWDAARLEQRIHQPSPGLGGLRLGLHRAAGRIHRGERPELREEALQLIQTRLRRGRAVRGGL